MKKRAIVTGGAGFIGSHLSYFLKSKDIDVLVLDNLSSGKKENIKDIEFIEIDIRDNLSDIFSSFKPNYVFHLAARPSVPFSIKNPVVTTDINITGTVNLLKLSLENSIDRFIFSSSSSVYGGCDSGMSSEDNILNPRSPYALQKLTGENFCKLFSGLGLDSCSLRYFNVFGERQDPNSPYAAVIPSFIKSKNENRPATIYGDGTQSRDFCHVDNVVYANYIAAIYGQKLNGESYNVGCGDSISLNDLASILHIKDISYGPNRDGDVKRSCANISKIKLLGYEIQTSFEDGLKKLI